MQRDIGKQSAAIKWRRRTRSERLVVAPRARRAPPPSLIDATIGDAPNGSDNIITPLITTSGGIMSEERPPSRTPEQTPRVKVEAKEPESDQKVDMTKFNPAPTAHDLSAEIAENNTELTEQIVNAIALTNSISGVAPNSGRLKLEGLFPKGNNSNSTTRALGTAAPLTAPAAPVAPQVAPQVAPPGQELSLLALLSSSNFLTPNEMALPLNDPSILMPTPFAPGQDANTLIQQQQEEQQQEQRIPAPSPAAAMAPIDSAIPAATLPAAIPAALQQHQHLLQQLTAYAVGGQQPIFPPGAMVGAPTPQSLMGGMIPTNYPMGGNPNHMVGGLHNMFAGIPQGLNPGIHQAGFPPGFNQGIAGIPAALHPGLARIPASLHRPGMGPFTNNNMGNLTAQATAREPSASSIPANQPKNNSPMAPAPRQSSLAPVQLDRFNVESSTAAKMPVGSDPQQHPNALKKRAPSPEGSDLLIKSREARWIIRYNELLEFRGEHGHCRVPHGYSANRKLSWWVMNQRAQFSHRNQGKKTWLTDDRIQLLNDIGFIWTPHLKRSGAGKKKGKSASQVEEEEEKKDKKEAEPKENVKVKEEEKEESPDDVKAPV